MDNFIYDLFDVWEDLFIEYDAANPDFPTAKRSVGGTHPFYAWIEKTHHFTWMGNRRVKFDTDKDALNFILKYEGIERL